jgi:hypothetical protein
MSDGTFQFIGDVLNLFVLIRSLSVKVVSEGGVFTLEIINCFLQLLISFLCFNFFTVKLGLLLFYDLLEGSDLIFMVFILILVELIEIIDVFGFLFEFFLEPSHSFSIAIVHIFDFELKRVNFFSETVGLTVEHLPDGSFFFDELLDFCILLVDGSFKFDNFILETLDVFLMIDSHLFDLAFMYSGEFDLEGIFIAFRHAFELHHLISE